MFEQVINAAANALYIFVISVAVSLAAVAVWLIMVAARRWIRQAIERIIDPHPNARLTIEELFALGPNGISTELARRNEARQAPLRGIVSRLRAKRLSKEPT